MATEVLVHGIILFKDREEAAVLEVVLLVIMQEIVEEMERAQRVKAMRARQVMATMLQAVVVVLAVQDQLAALMALLVVGQGYKIVS